VLQEIRAARRAGASLRDIADALNQKGSRTRSGSPWRHQYVASLLTKEESGVGEASKFGLGAVTSRSPSYDRAVV
jgi:hypothetical protein